MRIGHVLLGRAWGNVDFSLLERGSGARESTYLRLSKLWAEMGHDVDCFTTREGVERLDSPEGGSVTFLPDNYAPTLLSGQRYDAILSWERPDVFDSEALLVMNADAAKVVGYQVAHTGYQPWQYVDAVVGLTPWHCGFLEVQAPEIAGRLHFIPNGVTERDATKKVSTNAIRSFWTSSPDRGLWHAVALFEELRRRGVDAELTVGYGAKAWADGNRWRHDAIAEHAQYVHEMFDAHGEWLKGGEMLTPAEVRHVQEQSNVWLYPCDPQAPTETQAVNAIEAMAAGCPVIISDADCLEATYGEVAQVIKLPFQVTEWADAAQGMLDVNRRAEYRAKGLDFVKDYEWPDIAQRWIDLFDNVRGSK